MRQNSRLAGAYSAPLRQWWYLGSIIVPIALLVGLLFVGLWQEWSARQQVSALLAQRKQRGEPTDNESLAQQFDAKTDHARALRLQRLADAAISIERLYEVAMLSEKWDDIGKLVPPNEEWKMTPVLESYSRDAQPIVAEAREILASAEPIWIPIIFQDYETLLAGAQTTRSIVRVLAYEARAAYHAGDHQRVIDTLALIPKLADAIDYQNFLVTELVRIALIGVHHGLVRESLSHDYWSVDEIALLTQQLEPTAGREEAWRSTIASEAAMAGSFLGIDDGTVMGHYDGMNMNAIAPFGFAPSQQLQLLNAFEQWAEQPSDFESGETDRERWKDDGGLQRMHTSTSLLAVPIANGDVVCGVVWPSSQAYTRAQARTHRERRWTRCALAIKQFQIQQQRWPKSLEELTQVGLTRSDWMAKPDMPFGYQVATDNSHALLWTNAPDGSDAPIEAVPPSTIEKHDRYLDMMEATIR